MAKRCNWERMIGQEVIDHVPPKKSKTMTAAEFKRLHCNKAAIKRGADKFSKASHLKGADLRKLSDSWVKRVNHNAGSFWKEANNDPR